MSLPTTVDEETADNTQSQKKNPDSYQIKRRDAPGSQDLTLSNPFNSWKIRSVNDDPPWVGGHVMTSLGWLHMELVIRKKLLLY